MVFDVRDENKELLKIYSCAFYELIDQIKKIDDDCFKYAEDYAKIKFNSGDNLSLNKPLKFYNMTVTIRCVISEDNKLHPQVFLDEALFSL